MFAARQIAFLKPSIKRLLSIALLILSNKIYADSSFPECMRRCVKACYMIPVTIPACIFACEVACTLPSFSSNTRFVICRKEDYVKDTGLCPAESLKEVSVEEVEVGDFVQTLPDDLEVGTHMVFTEVIGNQKSSGDYKFRNIKFKPIEDNSIDYLEVTPEHYLIVLTQNSVASNENIAEEAFMLKASEAHEGMLLPSLTGAKRILEVKDIHYPVKYTIETRTGTILASGIFTTTAYKGTVNNGTKFLDAIKQYQESRQIQHKYMAE
ncbi:hypothetical protein [Endozoicomonas sp. 4G]|uniref:hypothetical protein n=1 Tax=Endozoicomonas sp. 4G TaxID=2872754 RepID=UPI002078836A|nr:hypothetical protein [Endozoicomonas sp. 4G]